MADSNSGSDGKLEPDQALELVKDFMQDPTLTRALGQPKYLLSATMHQVRGDNRAAAETCLAHWSTLEDSDPTKKTAFKHFVQFAENVGRDYLRDSLEKLQNSKTAGKTSRRKVVDHNPLRIAFAKALVDEGYLVRGIKVAATALGIATQSSAIEDEVIALELIAQVLTLTGDYGTAIERYLDALDRLGELEDSQWEGKIRHQLLDAYEKDGQFDEAVKLCDALVEIIAENSELDVDTKQALLSKKAVVLAKAGNPKQALELLTEIKENSSRLIHAQTLVKVLTIQNQHSEANAVLLDLAREVVDEVDSQAGPTAAQIQEFTSISKTLTDLNHLDDVWNSELARVIEDLLTTIPEETEIEPDVINHFALVSALIRLNLFWPQQALLNLDKVNATDSETLTAKATLTITALSATLQEEKIPNYLFELAETNPQLTGSPRQLVSLLLAANKTVATLTEPGLATAIEMRFSEKIQSFSNTDQDINFLFYSFRNALVDQDWSKARTLYELIFEHYGEHTSQVEVLRRDFNNALADTRARGRQTIVDLLSPAQSSHDELSTLASLFERIDAISNIPTDTRQQASNYLADLQRRVHLVDIDAARTYLDVKPKTRVLARAAKSSFAEPEQTPLNILAKHPRRVNTASPIKISI